MEAIQKNKMETLNDWKSFEKFLISGLKNFGLIDQKFTGQVTLHFNEGGLSDIEKLERRVVRRLRM
jgi:hypothetical protein